MSDQEALELEHGEDIDHIANAIRASASGTERLLEQVKHREPPITLQSEAARSAIANYNQHRLDNPGVQLRFRFTTTASVGRERRNVLPNRLPGITAWEHVRTETLHGDEAEAILSGLRDMLGRMSKPEGVRDDQWLRLLTFVRQAERSEWTQFVKSFEWSTGVPDSASLRPAIRQILLDRFPVGGEVSADLAYQHLFAFVFDLLSVRGPKLLTYETLIHELNRARDAIGSHRIAELAGLHHALAGQVDELQSRVVEMGQLLVSTVANVESLAQNAGISAVLSVRPLAAPSLSPPLLARQASERSGTVDAILVTARGAHVIALHGGIASGKTQLALLIARQLGRRIVWVRLQGLDAHHAAARLLLAADSILETEGQGPLMAGGWGVRATSLANAIDALVLDDVPQFRDGDDLAGSLVAIVSAYAASNRPVIVTSSLPLASLGRILSPDTIVERPVPALTREEIGEVLRAYGAPEGVAAERTGDLVTATSRGHPLLVHALAQDLQRRNWVVDAVAFESIMRNAYAEPVNRETAQLLLQQIADSSTRELVYRLAVIKSEFGLDELAGVSSVPPAISARRERFTALLGPWVQAVAQDRYDLSPLVRALGPSDLDRDVLRGCHRAIGRLIVGRTAIGQVDFTHALTHFVGAEEWDTAGVLLLRGLHSLSATSTANPLITSIWNETPLPPQMSPSIRAMIRAFQAVIAHRAGEDPRPRLHDLVAIYEASPDLAPWAVFAPSLLVAVSLALDNAVLTGPFLRRALTHWPFVRDEVLRAADQTVSSLDLESIVWLSAAGVKDEAGLNSWSQAVEVLPEIGNWQFVGQFAREAAVNLADTIWLWEFHAPADERDWSRAVARLEQLEELGSRIGAVGLVAAARSARLSAVVEQTRDLSIGAGLAHQSLNDFSNDPEASFLVARAMGMSALDQRSLDEALAWLQKADSMQGSMHNFERVDARLRLARLVSVSDRAAAREYAEGAVDLARARVRLGMPGGETSAGPTKGDTRVARALGELALAHWFEGNQARACAVWLDCLDWLVAGRNEDDESWRSLFVVAGHVSGYLTSMMTANAPPASGVEGDVPYTVPWQGILITPPAAAADAFRKERVPLIGVHAMLIADEIGEHELATGWASRSSEQLKALGLWVAASLPLQRLAQQAILDGDFAAAFQIASDAVAALWVKKDEGSERLSVIEAVRPPREVLGSRETHDWSQLDGMVISRAVLPAFVRVAGLLAMKPDEGSSLEGALTNACAQEAELEPEAGVWHEAVAVCEAAFHNGSERSLMSLARELAGRGDSFRSLAVMAQLAASFQPEVLPTECLRHQLGIVAYLQMMIPKNGLLYETVLLEFFVPFWRRTFEESRVHFTAPRLVGADLDRIERLPASIRLESLVQVIARGLSIHLPKRSRMWIEGAIAE